MPVLLILCCIMFGVHAADLSAGALSADKAASKRSQPIVITIKPLYSLVAHITAGIETPVLLMQQVQSPHHFTLKPSQRRMLANARIIVWLGPQLESALIKIIQQQATPTITALQAKNLKLLKLRHDKSLQHENSEPEAHESHRIDPHVWLSTENAIAISQQIAAALIENDPENTAIYQRNLALLQQKIAQTKHFISSRLQNKRQPFIVFHDAFQYFEVENGLNYIDSISFSENSSSLNRIRKIKTSIEKNNIHCLLYQEPKPAIIDTLTQRTATTAIALDPLGINAQDDKNAWFDIMHQLTLNFERCLNL